MMHTNKGESMVKMAHYYACKYSWATRYRNDIDLADLQQAAFLGILRAKKVFDPAKAPFATYAGFYARKELRDLIGIKQGKIPPALISLDEPIREYEDETRLDMIPDTSIPDPDEKLIAEERKQSIRDAVNRLQDDQRAVILSRFFNGLTYQQTAKELHISPDKAVRIYQNARRSLQRDIRIRELYVRSTRYMLHMGIARYNSTLTSPVEELVILRERLQNMIFERLEEEKEVDKDNAYMV